MTVLEAGLDRSAESPVTGVTDAPWVLRINPLRGTRLARGELRELLQRLIESEELVELVSAQCDAQLYELIGAADEPERSRLLQLRRDVRRGRPPAAPSPIPAVARWASAFARRQRVRDDIVTAYPACVDGERETLATLLSDDDLRCSLSLLAPDVLDEAQRYTSAYATGVPISARARKSARKAERGLIQYVTRAMVRTSPLARFTAVGLAVPGAGGTSPEEVTCTGAVAFPSLDRVMLAYVLGGLGRAVDEELHGAWVGLAPTSRLDSQTRTFFFLRPTADGFTRCSAAATGSLGLLLQAVAMGPRDMSTLSQELSLRAGCTPDRATALIASGVVNGVLCTYEQEEDGTASLADMLSVRGADNDPRLHAAVARLASLATAPVRERGAALAAIGEDLSEVSLRARRPAQITIEEDFVLPPATVDPRPWRTQLTDLGAAVDVLSVFDWLHDVRILSTAVFVVRFGLGANVSLVENADALLEEVTRRVAAMGELLSAAGAGSVPDLRAVSALAAGDSSLGRLHVLRRDILETARVDLSEAAAQQEEVRWSASDIAVLTAAFPDELRRDPLSYGALVQPVSGGLVLNDGLPGHGMLYSRFLGADTELGGRASSHLRARLLQRYGWDGSRVVEDLGLHRLNVNAHPQILPDGLRAADWAFLRLVHDPRRGVLRVEDQHGQALRVLALGTGHPALFPAPLSIATCLNSGGRLRNTMHEHWHASTAWDGQRTQAVPRINVGTVVVARRRWYGGAELDTAVAAGPGEHDRLLAMTAWRARHDVPEEVVIKTAAAEASSELLQGADLVPRRQHRKPQYVDLASSLGNRVLPKMLQRRAETGVSSYVEEALPGVVDNTNAYEWVVEIGHGPGGRFHYEGTI